MRPLHKLLLCAMLLLTANTNAQPKTGYALLKAKAMALKKTAKAELKNIHSLTDQLSAKGDLNYISPITYQLLFRDVLKKQGDPQYAEKLATSLSFICDYKNALAESGADKVYLQPIDTSMYTGVTLTDALPYITEQARQTRAVFINESPYMPQHRLYATIVLQQLKAGGYTHLILDAKSNSNKIEQVTANAGYALREPLYADLIRQALTLGYTIVSFSRTDTTAQLQSAVITSLLQQGDIKALVYTSGNIEEQDASSLPAIVKQQSGIDPLTINQSSISETGSNMFNTSLFYYWQKHHVFTKPMLLMNGDKPWNLSENKTNDLYIVHPRTGYVNNRPAWLQYYNYRLQVYVSPPLTVMRTAFLLQAYLLNETNATPINQLIPVDQTYYEHTRQVILFLKPHNRYKIVFRDINNNILSNQTMDL